MLSDLIALHCFALALLGCSGKPNKWELVLALNSSCFFPCIPLLCSSGMINCSFRLPFMLQGVITAYRADRKYNYAIAECQKSVEHREGQASLGAICHLNKKQTLQPQLEDLVTVPPPCEALPTLLRDGGRCWHVLRTGCSQMSQWGWPCRVGIALRCPDGRGSGEEPRLSHGLGSRLRSFPIPSRGNLSKHERGDQGKKVISVSFQAAKWNC